MTPRFRILTIGGILLLSAFVVLGCPLGITHFGWVYSIGSDVTVDCITRSPQGGYFIVGYGQPSANTQTPLQMMVLKLSDTGAAQWSHFISNIGGYLGAAVPDGGVVLVGRTGTSVSDARLHVAKQDSIGNSVWGFGYGATGSEYLRPTAMIATSDGGCMIAGKRHVGSEMLPFLLKLDPQGDVVWERNMDPQLVWTDVTKITPVVDDGVVMSGVLSAGRLLRVDAQGNLLWWKQYDGDWNSSQGFAVDTAPDGGFVLAGSPWKSDDTCVPVVIRTDADGNVLWTVDDILRSSASTWTSTYYTAHDMLVDGEGRIVIVGEKTTSYFDGIEFQATGSGYIMQLSSTGHLNWYKSLSPGQAPQTVNRVTLTASGDYITLGQTAAGIQVIRVSTAGAIM